MYSVYYGLLLLEASKHLKWKLCSGGGGGRRRTAMGMWKESEWDQLATVTLLIHKHCINFHKTCVHHIALCDCNVMNRVEGSLASIEQ